MKALGPVLLVALVGCSSGAGRVPAASVPAGDPGVLPWSTLGAAGSPIKHIVIIVQENRTIDNLFAGFPNADTQAFGKMSNGRRVTLQQVSLNSPDIDNSYGASIQSFDGGKMDGFDRNELDDSKPAGRYAYSYVDRRDIEPYWEMAKEFTLADHMFPTTHGQSWSAHIDLIASTTNLSPTKAMVDFPSASPWDCSAPAGTVVPTIDSKGTYDPSGGPFPCFTQIRTMADTLDAAHVSWRFYAPSIQGDWIGGAWSSFSSISKVRHGPDWKNIVTPPPTILTDVAAGKLAGVTWVAPDWTYSDHAGSGTTLGPSWVAAVVNTIGKSRFWDSTAIVVVWDDFGGWYDHEAPPQLDFKGLGIRVPCLIVSPYVRRGYVIHTQYEFGSVLKLVEETYGLPALGSVADGYSDARSNSMLDAFDFTQKPRAFGEIHAPVFPGAFLRMKPSGRVPDN
jgi:phospholipase C